MAMTPCKECGTSISTKADACPSCGAPVRRWRLLKGFLVILFLFLLVILFAQPQQKTTTPASALVAPPASVMSSASRDEPFDSRKHFILANALALEYYKLLTNDPEAPVGLFPDELLPTPVSANFLYTQSVANVAALDRDLKGKRILIKDGLATSVSSGPKEGWYTVELPGGVAIFERDADYVAKMKIGQQWEMVCSYQSGGAYPGFMLADCRGLSAEAEFYGSMAALGPKVLGTGAQVVAEMKERITDDVLTKLSQCTTKVSLEGCFGEMFGQSVQ